VEVAQEALAAFAAQFEAAFHAGSRRKLGLFTAREEDPELMRDLLNLMAESKADFTLTFRRLSEEAAQSEPPAPGRPLFADPLGFDTWAARWRARLNQEPEGASERATAMKAVNPAYIPRNHQVEAAIVAAVQRHDFAPFDELLSVLSRPFEEQPGRGGYAGPPEPHQKVTQTFCGT
jgi:uncharacterized protein YdiU (UPF0061 family)